MSFSAVALAALITAGAQTQDPGQPPPTDLEEITVEGQSPRQAARQFVQRVATAPAGARLGRWNTPLCVSVAGLKAPYGQMLADRIAKSLMTLKFEWASLAAQPMCSSSPQRMVQVSHRRWWKVGVVASVLQSTTPTWDWRRWSGSKPVMRQCDGGTFPCRSQQTRADWRPVSPVMSRLRLDRAASAV